MVSLSTLFDPRKMCSWSGVIIILLVVGRQFVVKRVQSPDWDFILEFFTENDNRFIYLTRIYRFPGSQRDADWIEPSGFQFPLWLAESLV